MKFSSFLYFFFVFIVSEVLFRPTDSEDHTADQGKEKPLVKDVGCINEIAGEIRKCIISESKGDANLRAFGMEVHSNWSQLAAERVKGLQDQLETEKNNSQIKDHKLLQLSLPVQINNEIDRFFELHQWQIKLTQTEETDLSKIHDKNMRSRLRLQMICQHVIKDLATEPLIKELNQEIDSVQNKNLAKCGSDQRRNYTCQALIMLKFDRNAKVHEVFVSGPKVKLVKLFQNDLYNEGITAFLNGHRTGVDFKGIEPLEVISAGSSK